MWNSNAKAAAIIICVAGFGLSLIPAAQCEEQPGAARSKVTLDVSAKQLKDAIDALAKDPGSPPAPQSDTVSKLGEKLGLTQGQVEAALGALSEAKIPPDRLKAKLIDIRDRFKDLQMAAAPQSGDDANLAALKAEVRKAIADGWLDGADELLAEIEKIQSAAPEPLALDAARSAAWRGDVAMARLRYGDAAARFRQAAAEVPQGHDDDRSQWLQKEGHALFRQGYELGEAGAVAAAIEALRHSLALAPPAENSFATAQAQNDLGDALLTIAAQESGTENLTQAITAYRAALKGRTRELDPLQWAASQYNLGNALETLGEREGGTENLMQAVAAYRAALEEQTRADDPLRWARSTGNQGVALMLIAQRTHDSAIAQQALDRITAAGDAAHDAGNQSLAAGYESVLPQSRRLVQLLSIR